MFYNLLISRPPPSPNTQAGCSTFSLRGIKRQRFASVRWQPGGEVPCFGGDAASRGFVSVPPKPGEPRAADMAENAAQNKWIGLAVAASASQPASRAG